MKKDLKNILEEIHKLAAPPPVLEGKNDGTKPKAAPSAPANTIPAKTTKQAPIPNNHVAQMQSAILSVAKLLQTSDVTSMDASLSPQGKGRGQFIGKPQEGAAPSASGLHGDNEKTLAPQEEELGGFEPFGNFLMSQYIKAPGHQYVNVDMEQPNRETPGVGSAIANNIRGLVQTLTHIGTPVPEEKPKPGEKKKPVGRGENVPDGVWDVRTNNALKNIAAIMGAMLNFAKDMKQSVTAYTSTDLSNFKSGIPNAPENVDPSKKEQIAAVMTQHLNKMKEFFTQFKTKVVDNPQYKSFISQQNAFGLIKMDKDKKKQLKTEEYVGKDLNDPSKADHLKRYYSAYKDQSPNSKYYGVEVPYGDLRMKFIYNQMSNGTAFRNRVAEYLGREPTADEIKQVFIALQNAVKSK
jgi:hypothetical protein